MADIDKFSLNNLDTNQDFNFLQILNNSELFTTHCQNDIDVSPYFNTDVHCKYMDETSFIDTYKRIESISYMSFNIQSLHAKFTSFCDLIQNLITNKCQPDIILLQEIWNITDPSLFNINGYTFISKNRTSTQGGGVGIYINSDYPFKILETKSIFIDRIIETLFIDVWLSKHKKITIGNIYRPPNHPTLSLQDLFTQFFDVFSNILDDFSNYNNQILLGGDFNLDALKYRMVQNVTDYIDMLFSYGFLQLIMKPTRCTSHSATVIDHFISNARADLHETVILTTKISDHFPIIYISKVVKAKQTVYTITYRDFSEANFLNFTVALNSINWEVLSTFEDTQMCYDYFSETFLTLFNIYFPLIKKNLIKIHSL